mgnify:CR=1 FL=1
MRLLKPRSGRGRKRHSKSVLGSCGQSGKQKLGVQAATATTRRLHHVPFAVQLFHPRPITIPWCVLVLACG